MRMKVKVIDLLNKIAEGKDVPMEIIYKGTHYYWTGGGYENDHSTEILFLFDVYSEAHLNDEVELVISNKDKKIEKLEEYGKWSNEKLGVDEIANNAKELLIIKQKINEIIDKLNEEEK